MDTTVTSMNSLLRICYRKLWGN